MVERAGINNKKNIESVFNELIPVQSVTIKKTVGSYFVKFKDEHSQISDKFIKNICATVIKLK
jgi:hypothetical protein